MRPISGREAIEIAAPRAEVYAFRLDCRNLPQLNPAVRNVRRVDGAAGPPSAGTRYTCDVDLHWGECAAMVEITQAVEPSLIVLEMETVLRAHPEDARRRVRSQETARLSATARGGTFLEVELTLYPAQGSTEAELAAMEANAGAPINVELAAMKMALETRPERVDEHNEQT